MHFEFRGKQLYKVRNFPQRRLRSPVFLHIHLIKKIYSQSSRECSENDILSQGIRTSHQSSFRLLGGCWASITIEFWLIKKLYSSQFFFFKSGQQQLFWAQKTLNRFFWEISEIIFSNFKKSFVVAQKK
jgi:hypothetical protein